MAKYRSMSLPYELIKVIEKFIVSHPEMGYSTVPEFLKEAIREKLNRERVKP